MSEEKKMPETGDKAPCFTLPDHEGKRVSLSGLKGTTVVLYFYPKDDTPGCTLEAKEFRDAVCEFDARGAVVLGISPDSPDSHCRFIDKFQLNFRLLSDTDHAAAEKYGVWVEKNRYGRRYMGVQRATFLIDKKGKIARVWPKVTPQGHAQQVLAALDAM